MAFICFECCGEPQEVFYNLNDMQQYAVQGKLFVYHVTCSRCSAVIEAASERGSGTGGRLSAAYGGKTVREIDKEYAHLEGVRHLERGTIEHKRHVEALREDGEQRAKEAGYRDRKHMRRTVRERKNINAAVAARGA